MRAMDRHGRMSARSRALHLAKLGGETDAEREARGRAEARSRLLSPQKPGQEWAAAKRQEQDQELVCPAPARPRRLRDRAG